MIYKYKCGNRIIKGLIRDDHDNYILIYDGLEDKFVELLEDENGKFFIWKKNKIYFNEWIRTSMKQFKEKIENNEAVTSNDLCTAILSDGVENVRFMSPMNTVSGYGYFLNGDEFKETLCKIEESRYRIMQNYKLTLVPVEPDKTIRSSRDFYISDILLLIRTGDIKIVV